MVEDGLFLGLLLDRFLVRFCLTSDKSLGCAATSFTFEGVFWLLLRDVVLW